MIQGSLRRILEEYPIAREQPFAQHELANFIRGAASEDVRISLGAAAVGLKIQGSAGAGNWATVPFDVTVTDSATHGYYVVYLFNASRGLVHLSLNQGTTAVRSEHGRGARDVLKDRARAIRRRIPEYSARVLVHSIQLDSTQTLPADYEAGHALGFTYNDDRIPSEEVLRDNLQELVTAYRALTF